MDDKTRKHLTNGMMAWIHGRASIGRGVNFY